MTTLEGFRTKARNFLKDVGTQKVSDAELLDYLTYALADYSYRFPKGVVATESAAATIAKPSAALPGESVDGIEIDGDFWEEFTFRQSASLPTTGQYWYWRGSETIVFASTPAADIGVHYRSLRDIPSADDDVLDVSVADEELLVIYVAAKYHQKVGTIAAKLDRFKEEGRRDDNPLVFMHDVLMRQYEEACSWRAHKGTVRIRSY